MKILDKLSTDCYKTIIKQAKPSKGRFNVLSQSHSSRKSESKMVALFSKQSEYLGDVKLKSRPQPKCPKKISTELFNNVIKLVYKKLDIEPEVDKADEGNRYIRSCVEREVAKGLKKCSKEELEELRTLLE